MALSTRCISVASNTLRKMSKSLGEEWLLELEPELELDDFDLLLLLLELEPPLLLLLFFAMSSCMSRVVLW